MKMYEQADHAAYSWIVDGIGRKTDLGRNLIGTGWKWITGARRSGCFVTKDRQLAERTAACLSIKIESNGTHAVIGIKTCLAAK